MLSKKHELRAKMADKKRLREECRQPRAASMLPKTVGLVLLGILSPVSAFGEQVTVQLQTDFSPTKFEGLVTSTSGVITEKINPAVEEIAPNLYAVTFPIEEKGGENQSVTAIALDDDGHLAVGPVIPSEKTTTSAVCSSEVIDPVTLEVDAGTIRALASNRLKRREHNQRIFELSLSQFPLSDIERIESRFGLSQSAESRIDLNPFRMVDRISRLLVALESWDYRKNAVVSTPTLERADTVPQSPIEGNAPSGSPLVMEAE